MNASALLLTAIDPALALLATVAGLAPSPEARLMMLAIAGQESAWVHRRQIGGPARSFWQFEQGGGVAGVFRTCPEKIRAVCGELQVPADTATVFEAMAWHDVLAAAMARLLLWSDAKPLPAIGDVSGGWATYQRTWRPGAPHPETWPARYGAAMGLVKA